MRRKNKPLPSTREEMAELAEDLAATQLQALVRGRQLRASPPKTSKPAPLSGQAADGLEQHDVRAKATKSSNGVAKVEQQDVYEARAGGVNWTDTEVGASNRAATRLQAGARGRAQRQAKRRAVAEREAAALKIQQIRRGSGMRA